MQQNENQLQHAWNQLVPCDVSAGRKSEKPIVCFIIIPLIHETWVLVISHFLHLGFIQKNWNKSGYVYIYACLSHDGNGQRKQDSLLKIRNLNNFISLYKIYFELSYKHIEKAPHTLRQPDQFSHSVSLLTSGNWTARIVKCSHTWRRGAWLLAFFPLPSANKATPQFPCVLQTGIYFLMESFF